MHATFRPGSSSLSFSLVGACVSPRRACCTHLSIAFAVAIANALYCPRYSTATLFVHVIALIMSLVMIFHIRSKYTAVGRKEILIFFYLYVIYTIFEMILFAGATLGTDTYPVCVLSVKSPHPCPTFNRPVAARQI